MLYMTIIFIYVVGNVGIAHATPNIKRGMSNSMRVQSGS